MIDQSPLLELVVRIHLYIENHLFKLISKNLEKPSILENKISFRTLVDIGEAMGTIQSDMASVLRSLNSIRNKYAHRIQFEPEDTDVDQLLKRIRDLDDPFFISYVPGDERELSYALSSLAGYFERVYGPLENNKND